MARRATGSGVRQARRRAGSAVQERRDLDEILVAASSKQLGLILGCEYWLHEVTVSADWPATPVDFPEAAVGDRQLLADCSPTAAH